MFLFNIGSIATPSICLYKISLKTKWDYLVAKDNNSLNSDLFNLEGITIIFIIY